MTPDRRDALRNYFIAVVKDMLSRGEIQRKSGQSLDYILRNEAARVLREVQEDLASITAEIGLGLAHTFAQSAINAGANFLTGALGKKR